MDRILIAEDDNIDRTLLEMYLQNSTYEIVSTKNGEEAWNIIANSENPPQIVIVDWMMPVIDGITLCKKIRGMEGPHYVYIILVTGKSMTTDMVQGLEAGADDYLTKPYDKAVLLARIKVGARILRLEQEKNEQLKKIQTTNRNLQQNMEAAVQIQLSLLPPRMYIVKNYQFDWCFKPSELLGGDMLHVYKLSDTKVACYVLDVSGHGTQAALLSVTIRNQLTVNSLDTSVEHHNGELISLESGSNRPQDVIKALSNHYGELLDRTGHYFTIVYGILDIVTGIFEYISAGHYNPIHLRNHKAVINTESSGAPIGMFRHLHYQQHQIQLLPGDKLYLFTDGIVEETNRHGEQFGLERLLTHLRQESNKPNSIETIIDSLGQWVDKESFKDDIALIEVTCRI